MSTKKLASAADKKAVAAKELAAATKVAKVEEVKVKKEAEAVAPNIKAVFSEMPHIHTVYVDEVGDWRFYETPGAKAIERSDINE